MRHQRIALSLAAFAIVWVAFFESYLPYYFAEHRKPPASSFLGQVAHTMDQDMYFSFVRQAYDGNVLFNNRLTAAPSDGAFVNIQFLAVGRAMRLLHLSENGVYQLWRFAGVLLLVIGFALLAGVVLPSFWKRLVSLCVFVLAGGFGGFFMFAGDWGLLSREVTFKLTLDLWSGLLPFQQLMLNPHFSLPHGLMLIGCALFLLAEEQANALWLYVACGVVFLVNGLVRPYDLISLAIVIPVFIASEAIRHFDLRISARRAIPLAILLPALVYSIWIFEFHPVFKYWSAQGHNIGVMSLPHVQILGYGSIGILAIARILQFRSNPFALVERFLLVWFVVILCCTHVGRVIPALGFSPQIGIPLFAPLVLFAFSLRLHWRRCYRGLVISLVAALVVIGNLGNLAYASLPFFGATDIRRYYASADETAALGWLNQNVGQGKVVVALPPVSGRVSKYSSASSLVGHHSVTPEYDSLGARVYRLLVAHQFTFAEHRELRDLGADYLFVGPEERRLLGFDPETAPGLAKVFARGSVAIYRVEPLAE